MIFLSRSIWVNADWDEPWEERKEYVTSALEAGVEAVIVKPEDLEKAQELGNITLVSPPKSKEANIILLKINESEEAEEVLSRCQEIQKEDQKVAILVEITGKEMEEVAVKAGETADFLITIAKDWKVIPLENLIAKLQKSKAQILAGVKTASEAKTAIETLEVGSDGVLFDPREKGAGEIKKVRKKFEEMATEKLELVPVEITKVTPAGMGDRACVDTTSLMKIGEGMLVGSQANGLFLVHSESLSSEYVEARPFRVNAGAVHAYVQAPGGKTRYLSELQAGDELVIVDTEGTASKVTIGRVKIERRPMLLIEAEVNGQKIKTLAQNAETINMVNEEGEPVPVTELSPGDKVLARVQEGGRHFGVKVDETLVER
ncbi:MAG: 3-dehydroquinate synthase II [Hadesarchaea archaeon]|nr:3-dehydroquinate synthase II [Hadesarchaea archaeon]